MARATGSDPPPGVTSPDGVDPGAGPGGLAAGIIAEEEVEPGRGDPSGPSTPVPVPGLRPDAGAGEDPSLGSVVRRYGALPLVVLTTLNLVDELDRLAFITLGPEIQKAFGLSDAALGAISGLSGLVVVLASVPMGVLADRYRRVPLVGLSALVWAAFAGLTGLVRNVLQLVVARLLSGVGKGSIEPVHTSLLADYYPVESRGRVLGAHRTANPLGQVIGPALAGGIAALAGGAAGWRWAFYVAVPLTLVPAIVSFFLREPRRGAHEESTVDELVPELGAQPSEEEEDGDHPRVPLATAVRRLLEIRSLKYMYSGIGVLGFGLVGAPVLISLYLEEVWGLQELGRGIFFSVGALGPLVGLPFGGKLGDRFYRHDPAWPLFILGVAIPVWTALVVGSLYLPTIWLVAAGWILAGAFLGLAIPAFLQLVAATAPPMFRSLAFSMFGVFLYVFGGFFGPAILGGASDAWGPRTALTLLVVPGVLAGILLVRGARFVHGDIAMVVEDLVERREARRRRDEGEGRSLVELRNIDFFYGQTQVLFGVDLDVPEGEIVALLGTNGAGKSTVLRVLTGLAHPRRGQIRFRGRDITYLEAEQILGLGIAQMPGGKAIFPDLTVEENLKVGAFTFRKDRGRVERDLEQVYTWFPVLGERRTQRASTLSGGEQQMLALGKAFLTRPELLCVDELSLGLAPTITASLLEIVREMHRRGTTIVIVEQSVNVALALATTAVFMEKGQVRYAGPAEELRGRTDLLRSVFLSGTGEA